MMTINFSASLDTGQAVILASLVPIKAKVRGIGGQGFGSPTLQVMLVLLMMMMMITMSMRMMVMMVRDEKRQSPMSWLRKLHSSGSHHDPYYHHHDHHHLCHHRYIDLINNDNFLQRVSSGRPKLVHPIPCKQKQDQKKIRRG